MEYFEMNGNKYEIDRYENGVPVIKAKVVTKEEANPDGTIKRSVEVIVPHAVIGAVGTNN